MADPRKLVIIVTGDGPSARLAARLEALRAIPGLEVEVRTVDHQPAGRTLIGVILDDLRLEPMNVKLPKLPDSRPYYRRMERKRRGR